MNNNLLQVKKNDSELMEIYRPAFAKAIAKLTNPNRYSDDKFIKEECVLTAEERNALLIYVPEILSDEFVQTFKK